MSKNKTSKTSKPYWEMSADELAEATKQFDEPMDSSDFKPLSAKERAKFERWRRGPSHAIFVSRSKKKKEAACQMVVDIDPALASHCAAFASAHHMTLAELVADTLRKATTFAK